MSKVTVEISKDLERKARKAAKASGRTTSEQIEHWIQVAVAALDNPDLPVTFVESTILAIKEPREAYIDLKSKVITCD